MFLLIDAAGRFPLGDDGEPLLIDAPPATADLSSPVRIKPGVTAARVRGVDAADLAGPGGGTGDARTHAGHPLAARAVGLVNARERYRYDPADGSELTWGDGGIVARGASGAAIFPRLDPCVIGVVEDPGRERILLVENSRRPGYFTLVAGYVDVGETLEAAFAREVWEETGRRVTDIGYLRSQPWPASGALMVGMTGRTADIDALGPTDGELTRTRWAARAELETLTLAAEGTIARALIEHWAHQPAARSQQHHLSQPNHPTRTTRKEHSNGD